MLTKEQLENAAHFMGISIEEDGVDINGLPWYWSPELDKHWMPEFDWNDFGPLLVLLLRSVRMKWSNRNPVRRQIKAFMAALDTGTDQQIMQAGLMLAAAIGKTMREEA